MDEPTAVLAPQEADELFATLRSMTAAGRSVVFISHKLGEVLAIADRITVMRRGRVTAAGRAPAGHDAGRSRPADGRPARPRGARPRAGRARPGRPRGQRRLAPTTTAACRPCATCRSTSVPARSSGSPRSRATARPSSPRSITGLRPLHRPDHVDGSDVANRPAGDAIRRGRRPRARGPGGRRQRARTSRSPTT